MTDTKENDLHKPSLKASMTPLSALSCGIAVIKGHKHACAPHPRLAAFTACEAEQSQGLMLLRKHTHTEDDVQSQRFSRLFGNQLTVVFNLSSGGFWTLQLLCGVNLNVAHTLPAHWDANKIHRKIRRCVWPPANLNW